MKRFLFVCVILSFLAFPQGKDIPSPTSFSIPSSPAFDLLGVSPSKVNKPGFLKDFKIDWLINKNSLAPDIAIDVQPVWLIFFKKIDRNSYLNTGYALKQLSTLSLSVANTKKDSINSIAFSVKVNLYREYDPIADYELIKKLNPDDDIKTKDILKLKTEIEAQLLFGSSDIQKDSLEKELKKYEEMLKYLDDEAKAEAKKYSETLEKKNWNKASIDIGYGRIENYLSGNLDSLNFFNGGNGLWISGAFGVGEEILLSGMGKYIRMNSIDSYFAGANFRYGSSDFNFFIEYVYESQNKVNSSIISYGGDYRLNKNLLIQFGLSTTYSKDLILKNLKPIINASWVFD